MKDRRPTVRVLALSQTLRWLLPAAAALLALLIVQPRAMAAGEATNGKEVVETVCVSCHGTGVNGAPKIGDRKAWSKRAAQGLSSLTQNALNGIRQMPAHGGSPGLTDFEIERAITYMVNKSGGRWAEPIDKAGATRERTGEQIVGAQCAKCHQTGVGGAPKIGDRPAWIARVKPGLDTLVRSAISGHGGMPARGGLADLTDAELRSAVVYMLNAGTGAASGQDYRVVEGTTVYFGVVPADVIRSHPNDYPASVYGSAPMLPDHYYVTIAAFDARSGQRITDAIVKARISGAAGAGSEKTLQAITIANAVSYGNYFPIAGGGPYKVSVHINRPGVPGVVQAQFQYRP
jgi:cytochrome c5